MASLAAYSIRSLPIVHAADSNLTNGITVDSTLDAADADGGTNGTCDDGAGNCTLRAAIQEANNNADTSTILFNISGSGAHTITLTSILPDITQNTIINGYSQPGASANQAVAPLPLNGTLTIVVNGSGTGSGNPAFRFSGNSAASEVRGLVINGSQGGAIIADSDDLVIAGNYIGTNAAGTAATPNNGSAITSNTAASGIQVGGLNAADRNLISGNTDGSYPNDSWVIQGNYVGVGANGVTAIPNSTSGGSGAFSIDNCSDAIVGGTQAGAINVISGNNSHGVAPDNSPGLRLQGNLIGTDYTGQVAVPNESGVVISGDQTGSIIGGNVPAARNIIAGNTLGGILSGSSGLQIIGNYVGLDKTGSQPLSNLFGIVAAGNDKIGGDTTERNVVSGNTYFNVSFQGLGGPQSGGQISGNYIGTNASGTIDASITAVQGEGIRLAGVATGNIIGGTNGNRIAGNRGSGVAVRSYEITGVTTDPLTPTDNAILGNVIFGNEPGGPTTGEPGLGIDLYRATASAFTFPADVSDADSFVDMGANTNDANDSDTSGAPDFLPNDYINHPIINSATQNGASLTVSVDLDAAGTTDSSGNYRIEFFANDTADTSGYGEGQTYLGTAQVSNGTSKTATITLANGTDLTGKVLSATTTAINTATDSGYGSTSEFSLAKNIQVLSTANGNLANTGQGSASAVLMTILFAATSAGTVHIARKCLTYQHKSR